MVYLFATYPGIWIQSDVSTVWHQVTDKSFGAWHTLGYEMFVFLCSLIYESSFTVNIVQTVLWIILNMYVLKVLQERGTRSMILYTVALVLVAAPFNYLEVMYKDVVFSMGILSVTVAFYHILKNDKIVWQDGIILSIGGAFACLCRHAGIVAVVVAFVITLLYFVVRKIKKVSLYMAGIIIFQISIYIFVNVYLMHSLNADKNPVYIKYTMPMVTIGAAASCNIGFFDAEDTEVLEMVMPVEEWGECYDKYWADTISRSYGKIGDRIDVVNNLIENEGYGLKLLKINAKLLVRHPYVYLKSILDMNNIIWKIANPNDGYVWALCTVARNDEITYNVPFVVTNSWTQFMCYTPVLNSVFARGGLSLFVVFFSVVVWFIQKERYLIIALMLIMMYNCILFITIPAQDPRYVLPEIECAIFLVAVLLGESKEEI